MVFKPITAIFLICYACKKTIVSSLYSVEKRKETKKETMKKTMKMVVSLVLAVMLLALLGCRNETETPKPETTQDAYASQTPTATEQPTETE